FDADILVIHNGKFSKELSRINSGLKNAFIGSFREGLKKHRDIIEQHFGKYANAAADGFTALNTSSFSDGVFIYAGSGCTLEKPVIIINFCEGAEKEVFSNTRNLIVTGKNSYADVSEVYYSAGSKSTFSNTVTEIFIDENSELHYNKIQNENEKGYHVGTTQVLQKNSSRFYSATVAWGGSLLRNNLNSVIDGEGIDCYFRGLYMVNDSQVIDNHTLADHAKPNSHSNELYKGIMDGSGQAVFNGKIMVRQDAQKTNAYQTNNNILLTNDASVNSKPQLEIFADDVKCSHGATTGQINPDEVFYLRARGISEAAAKKLLLSAYAHEIIDEIKNEELKKQLVKMLDKKLG
ncbi:MAG: Fe-S cluster assembly protein SufD, partial [Ignavibacteria bacterium]|nr:Fe-S cluster assembly protein SufD [Ignavibacteria bacterium]